MNLKTFKTKIEIIDKKSSDKIRTNYINKFVNVNSKMYKEQIMTMHKFKDGYCYLGYLWDYLKDPVIVNQNYITEVLKYNNIIYVLWHIHSCERIFINNYWKFRKDAVIKLKLELFIKGKEYLPEDLYIFDESFSWTLIQTHEYVNGKRYCLKSGDI